MAENQEGAESREAERTAAGATVWGCKLCSRPADVVITDALGVERGACALHADVIRGQAVREAQGV